MVVKKLRSLFVTFLQSLCVKLQIKNVFVVIAAHDILGLEFIALT